MNRTRRPVAPGFVTRDRPLVIRSFSDRQIAAVHRHRAAGHPTRLVGGKKQHGPDEIVGWYKPPERDHCLCRTPCFGSCIARARKSGSVGPVAIALAPMSCAARSAAFV